MSSAPSTTRPIVFMDIKIGETPARRHKMELFGDIVPKPPAKEQREKQAEQESDAIIKETKVVKIRGEKHHDGEVLT
ncbi:hypothetical protein K435DRAFT_881342 [Dendrothele bispora CBS 962.96]|uniref:Uncharacterized protein n=1 Tax=Dendrothele bispora (strain CBS 962.96) TaxID=1314807 RepID=A0A4S8KIL2_DENBC|nr:hypothetical protein K435DRAFT_881342 [Dendrothele bispora CBS 962.96]